MSDTPYVSVHGVDLTAIVDVEGVTVSGGGKNIDSMSQSGMDYATVLEGGREAATYSFQMHSSTRANLERARQEVNTCPSGSEFSPFTEDQVCYIEHAYSTPTQITKTYSGQHYYSEAVVVCQNALMYGQEGGIPFQRFVTLPKTASVTNNGYYPSGIDAILASGSYVAGGDNWTAGLSFELDDTELLLCDKLLGDDRFTVDRFGNCKHAYETEFKKLYAEMQNDLHGSTFFDYGTSGHVLENDCFIGPNGKIYISFYGPLLAESPPSITVDVSDLYGLPEVEIAYVADLSDSDAIDYELHVGENEIYFPLDSIGKDFMAIGITTDASSNITMSSFEAEIKRYIGLNELQAVDPGDTSTLTISDEANSNHYLNYLLAVYRDIY